MINVVLLLLDSGLCLPGVIREKVGYELRIQFCDGQRYSYYFVNLLHLLLVTPTNYLLHLLIVCLLHLLIVCYTY